MQGGTSITITTGTIIRTLLILAAAWLLYELWEIILVMLTAVVIASAIEPAAKRLMVYRLPRTLSVIIVYASFLGVLFGVLYLFIPILLSETATFVASLPRYLEYVQYVPAEYAPILDVAKTSPTTVISTLVADTQLLVNDFSRDALSVVSMVFGGILSFVLIVVFSFYFSIQERGIEDFLRVISPLKYEDYVVGLWRRSQQKIGLWMQGQLILGFLVGVFVYLGLSILQVEHALVLAVIAGVFELIPVFGPTLSAIPAILVGFGSGGVATGIPVIILYVIIQQFENHLLYPLVVTRVVGVPPLLVILGLIIGAKLAGVLGILLSVPVAAVIQELIGDAEKERRRGSVSPT